MVSQQPFPLDILKSLNELDRKALAALKITEVRGFVSRTTDSTGCDNIRNYLGWTREQMDVALNEARNICPAEHQLRQFAAGALIPNKSKWNPIEEWKACSVRQKIILSIYALVSLPFMPFYMVMIPFAWWVTTSKGQEPRKVTIVEFLSMSMASSLFVYLFIGLARCAQ